GIITAAVLKLFPKPTSRVTALAAVSDGKGAVALLRRLKEGLSDRLVAFELISGVALALCRKHHPDLPDPLPGHAWYALIQVDDSSVRSTLDEQVETAFGAALEEGCALDVAIAHSDEQAQALWALRENISESQRREGPNVKHDISLPVSAIPEFLDVCERALSAAFPGAQLVVFGHLGDGNLHYNLAAPSGQEAQRFMDHAAEVNRIVHDLVTERGGSISAEHGIGQLKREELTRYKDPLELELMRAIKTALDPAGLLNPGKVL
ncbi:MAG: hydroxyacid dehydrogenase, partial [Pseudomonadota bacterium]|nr:hydroxyacid dehydrogenase [Pseudomonadota bacterium]